MKINHDLHIHSTLSSCCHDAQMTPETILAYAKDNGYQTICLTNHLWDGAVAGASAWYQPQDIVHIQQALPLPQVEGVRFFFGCEAEYLGKDKLSLSPENYHLFDFIVIPINHMHMKGFVRPVEVTTPEDMAALFTQRAEELLALPLPFEKIGLAHLNTNLMFLEAGAASVLRLCDRRRWRAIFEKVANLGAGVELNGSELRGHGASLDASLEFFSIARDSGCRFYLGSDAHEQKSLDISCLANVIEMLGLTEAQKYHIP